MKRTLSEAQVLKRLDIEDFRHLTKDKVVSMAAMLDKMDPEVAKKALEQFPEFAATMKQIFSEFKQFLDVGLKTNAEDVKSYYESCDRIIATCQKELEKDQLTCEERRFILEMMMEVVRLKGAKNTENKRFIITMTGYALTGVVVIAGALITAIGGSFKSNTNSY